jgi:hypothetical protein
LDSGKSKESRSTASIVKVVKLTESERDFIKKVRGIMASDVADMRRRFNSLETAWKDKIAYYDKLLKN